MTAPRLIDRVQRIALHPLTNLPGRARDAARRHSPVNTAGDRLEPELRLLLLAMRALVPEFADMSVERARAQIEADSWIAAEEIDPLPVEHDVTIPGPAGPIPARRYRARHRAGDGLLVWFHGGGWTVGGLASHASPVRFLARHAGVDVLAIDYRLAPEHPFPAALEDARAAWDFAVAHAADWDLDPTRIAVGGDSAGANISAVLCNDLRGTGVTPRLQLLFYPATDMSRPTPSRREFDRGFFLTSAQIDWYESHYLTDRAQASDPRVSPLLEPDLGGTAPAYIAVAGFDPLRDEGAAYAKRLIEAGVPAELAREGELVHAFANMTRISPGSRAATLRAAKALRAALDGRSPANSTSPQ